MSSSNKKVPPDFRSKPSTDTRQLVLKTMEEVPNTKTTSSKPILADSNAQSSKRLKWTCVVDGCADVVKWGYEPGKPLACVSHKKECAEKHDGREPYDTYRHRCLQCLEEYINTNADEPPTRATYGYEDENPTHCSKHAEESGDTDLCDLTSKKCEGPGNGVKCTHSKKGKQCVASIGIDKGKPRWCATCKPTDVPTFNAHCSCSCGQIASFGKSGTKKATHCGDCNTKHKLGLVDVKHTKCISCGKQACYGFPDQTLTHCSICARKENEKLADEGKTIFLVDLKNAKCVNHETCGGGQPTWGIPGKPEMYCAPCGRKIKDAIDLHHIMCSLCNKIRANDEYSTPELKICGTCYIKREKERADLIGKKAVIIKLRKKIVGPKKLYAKSVVKYPCMVDGCGNSSTFGYEMGKPIVCNLPEHISTCIDANDGKKPFNTYRKYCIVCMAENKLTYAVFSSTTNNPTHCGVHKQDGMTNIHTRKCEGKEGKPCPKGQTALFGITYPRWCGTCKLMDASVKNLAVTRCDCGEIATFGIPGQGVNVYCKTCATNYPDAVYSRAKPCIDCGDYITSVRYGGMCQACFYIKNPDVPLVRNCKVKELQLRKIVQDVVDTFPHVKVLGIDKILPGGCSKRRPDYAIDCGTHIVIFECDENQHRDYDTMCDNKRTMEIFQDCGFVPVHFVRFNPDKSIDETGKQRISCFKLNKETGNLVVNKYTWQMRTDVLKTVMANVFTTIPEKEISITYLYYDGPEINGDTVLD